MSLLFCLQILQTNARALINMKLYSQKVDFLIGGVQKSGTTALHSMLQSHPNVFLPSKKELHYFNSEKYHQGKEHGFDNYHRFFFNAKKNQLCGEATPAYIYSTSVPTRVKLYNPKMKWIIILRHPVSRAFSHWNMQKKRGIEELSFTEAIEKENDRLNSSKVLDKKRFAYLHRSRYSNQIQRLFMNFDKKQCHFLTSESLENNTHNTVVDICDFLNIPFQSTNLKRKNVGKYSEFLDSTKKQFLTDTMIEEIQLTEELTGLNLHHWLTV